LHALGFATHTVIHSDQIHTLPNCDCKQCQSSPALLEINRWTTGECAYWAARRRAMLRDVLCSWLTWTVTIVASQISADLGMG